MLLLVYNRLKSFVDLNVLSIKKTILAFNKEAHQLTNTTQLDRYPEIFKLASTESKLNFSNPLVLSFGCSTGEECCTINSYFENSRIIGADINRENLKIAKAKFNLPNVNFIYSDYENIKKEGPFNAIFCMSVLCRWEESKYTDDVSTLYSFEKFESTIEKLYDLLSINGLLIIYNANFRFSDSKLYDRFTVVKNEKITESGFVYKFGKNNFKLTDQSYDECIFKKIK